MFMGNTVLIASLLGCTVLLLLLCGYWVFKAMSLIPFKDIKPKKWLFMGAIIVLVALIIKEPIGLYALAIVSWIFGSAFAFIATNIIVILLAIIAIKVL